MFIMFFNHNILTYSEKKDYQMVKMIFYFIKLFSEKLCFLLNILTSKRAIISKKTLMICFWDEAGHCPVDISLLYLSKDAKHDDFWAQWVLAPLLKINSGPKRSVFVLGRHSSFFTLIHCIYLGHLHLWLVLPWCVYMRFWIIKT